MSDPPNASQAGSGEPDGGRRPVAAQACDACRVSKTRCEKSSIDTPRSLDQRPSASPHSPSPTLFQCTRCLHTGKACTFLMPVSSRGPRKRSANPPSSKSGLLADVLHDRQRGNSGVNRSGLATSISAFTNILNDPLPTAPTSTSSSGVVISDTSESLRSLDNGSLRSYYSSPEGRFEPDAGSQPGALTYQTNKICSRPHLLRIIDDYLLYLYPLVPVVHRPSFRRDVRLGRDASDQDFLALVVGICASVVAVISPRFADYLFDGKSVRFESRSQMVNCCSKLLTSLRGPDYFEKINHYKWAVAYLMTTAFYHTGEHNRAQMMNVEAMQFARFLGLHDHFRYSGLNFIEVQLRKKAFWLTFYSFVHTELQDLSGEFLPYLDARAMNSINFQDLMPLGIDDEYLLEEKIIPSSPTTLHVTEGFNLTSRVFWAALTPLTRPDGNTSRECYPQISGNSDHLGQAIFLRERTRQVKYMLDDAPKHLQQWIGKASAGAEEDENTSLKTQLEIVRANLHLTHLWMQSILYDHVVVLQSKLPLQNQICSDELVWNEREDISKQLLHVVHSIDPEHLMSNGYFLILKLRDVAGSLFTCPFAPGDERSLRAGKYLRDFAEILSYFDDGDRPNLLSQRAWVNTALRPQPPDHSTPC